jgi:hypothetical protein
MRTGPFTLDDAWTLAELAMADFALEWPSIAIHPDDAMWQHPAIVLDGETAARWRNGGHLRSDPVDAPVVRVYDDAGQWLGIGRFDSERGAWRPVKVAGVAA